MFLPVSVCFARLPVCLLTGLLIIKSEFNVVDSQLLFQRSGGAYQEM